MLPILFRIKYKEPIIAYGGGPISKMKEQIMYNTIGTSVTLFFQWAIMMLIPKFGNFSDAGVFAIALSICSIMNIIATLSLNTYQIADQYEKFSENDYFICRVITIATSFVLCIVTILVLGYSAEQSWVIIGYMLYRNFLHFAYLHTATLQIREHLDYAGKCMIIEGIVSFVSFMGVYLLTKDLVVSTIVMALLGGGSFLLTVSLGYKKYIGTNYPMHLEKNDHIKPLLLLGMPLLVSTVAPIIITALPKLILQQYWGDELVGIYSTLTAPTIIIPTLITSIFAPFIVSFSNYAKNGDMKSIRKKYLKMVVLSLLFGIVALIVSLLLAEFFFKLLYGDYIIPYVQYFHYLVIGIVIYSIGMCGVTVLITKNQGREAAIATGLALVISFAVFMMTIPEYGIDAATYGLVISYAVFAVFVSLCAVFIPTKIN